MYLKKIRVAVFGCGYLGKWHIEKVIAHPATELIAIVEAGSSAVENAQNLFPNTRVVTDLNEIIEDIDAALIVTPTSFHFKLTEILIKKGKHVFCEKPLTDNIKDARLLCELNLEKGQVAQVGHSERFHKVWNLLKNDDELTPFFSEAATITIDRYAPFKGRATDVDVVSDLMIHDLDLLWFLFRESPYEITTQGFKISTQKWDHVTAEIKFSSGRKAILTCGRNHAEEQRKLKIVCAQGTLIVDLMKQSYSYAKPGATAEEIDIKSYERADHLFEEQDLFYKAILNKSESFVSIEDGTMIVEWIDAVQRSLAGASTIKL